jgi:pyruvate dehydrogenase E2 component (dihydrolipoamide acetyltransferase)
MAVEFFIHKMSEHMETAQILNWLVKEGDRVELYQPIIEVMTDKVSAEVESPAAGVIKGIRAGAVDGATVPVGEPICFIAAEDEAVRPLPPLPGYEPTGGEPQGGETGGETPPLQEAIQPGRGEVSSPPHASPPPAAAEDVADVRASPVARRVAKEFGVDLSAVKGTGPQGRISEADVRAHAAALAAPPAPETPPAAAEYQWLDLTPIQKLTGERLRESIVNAPQFALDAAADMTQLLWLRDQLADRVEARAGARLSITGLLVMVVADALTRHPRARAEYVPWSPSRGLAPPSGGLAQGSSTGGRLKVLPNIHLGVAVGTEDGLVVPVIRDADRKSLSEITRQLAAFQEKARTLRFGAEDLGLAPSAGGVFTLSNLGMYGVDGFRAIVNPPQSAILATGRIINTPVGMPDGAIALRPMMNLTLTADHRCMDGVQAARFLAEVKELLEQPHLLFA